MVSHGLVVQGLTIGFMTCHVGVQVKGAFPHYFENACKRGKPSNNSRNAPATLEGHVYLIRRGHHTIQIKTEKA
jgi:hypothetical protein